MSVRGLTRRSLLGAAAGTAAGGLLRPAGVLAALAGPPRPILRERSLGELSRKPTTIALGRVADLVGVQWDAAAAATVELRFRGEHGGWSSWVSAGWHGHGPEGTPAGALVGDPVWTGGTTVLQLRASRTLSGVRIHLVDVSGGVGARKRASAIVALASARALALASPALAAGAGQPPIIARRAWARRMAPPRVAPEYGAVRLAFVHHTENPNGYTRGEVPAMLLAIYVFHRYVNGWNDIGYNFVIDLYGRIFEARAGGIDESVVGAHAGGYNLLSTGIAVLGSFTGVPISAAARGALERLLAWKLSLHGLPAQGSVAVQVNPAGASYSRFPANARVSLPRIAGHRDGDSTECPGDALYGELPSIRPSVHALAPHPTRATLALSAASAAPPAGQPAPASTPTPTPTPTGGESSTEAHTLTGSLQFLDGTPIVGAPILVQARTVSARGEVVSERTIAEVVTDAQGAWSLSAAFSAARAGWMWLRVLCVGTSAYGAAVSEPLRVAVTAAPSPPPAPVPSAPGASPPAP